MWKCRRKNVFEYAPVAYVIWTDVPKNHAFSGIPEWVREAFKQGRLRYGKDERDLPTLEIERSCMVAGWQTAPIDGYIVHLEDGIIGALSRKSFDAAYEIID